MEGTLGYAWQVQAKHKSQRPTTCDSQSRTDGCHRISMALHSFTWQVQDDVIEASQCRHVCWQEAQAPLQMPALLFVLGCL